MSLLEVKEDLRKWFGRKGAKGKTGGWVDCNAPDGKGGYKPCGRKKGEKRKYPACRPTPAGCKDKGKGKKWGKKSGKSKKMKKEDLMSVIREELSKIKLENKKSKKKDDACTRKVKARYKVWPSAYASGAVAKCRKVGAANWGNKSKKNEVKEILNFINEGHGLNDQDAKDLKRIVNFILKSNIKQDKKSKDLSKSKKDESALKKSAKGMAMYGKKSKMK